MRRHCENLCSESTRFHVVLSLSWGRITGWALVLVFERRSAWGGSVVRRVLVCGVCVWCVRVSLRVCWYVAGERGATSGGLLGVKSPGVSS